jgi:hypothetical protein
MVRFHKRLIQLQALAAALLIAAAPAAIAGQAQPQGQLQPQALTTATSPDRLTFTFDYEHARIVCKLLSTGDFNAVDVAALRAHSMTAAAVRKLRMKSADEFVTHLQGQAKKQKVPETAARLLAELNKPNGGRWAPVAGEATRLLKAYVPAQFAATLKVYFYYGMGNGGFAFDDVPDDVYVRLSEDPVQDIGETVAHELFHAVQTHVMPPPPRTTVVDAAAGSIWMHRLLYDLVQEATAELFTHAVADRPAEVPGPSKIRFEKNNKRMHNLPILFETIALRLLWAPPSGEDAYDRIYGLLFYGDNDSPAYDLGWLMAKTIENKDGKAAIFALLKEHPKQFVLRYQALAMADTSLPKFGEDFILKVKAL